MNYYYRDSHGLEVGPLPKSELSQLRQTGLLSDESLVRAEGDSDWTEYRTAMAGPAWFESGENAQSVATSPPSSKVDRLARARKFSWLLFSLAILCFLLPFIAVTQQQRQIVVSGSQMITGGGNESINTTLVLGLTITAMLFALARKPFSAFLGAVCGVVGVATLIILKSSLEQAVAARGAAISMREGFWLASTLLTSGAVVQLTLLRDASVSDGWKFRKKHYATLACLSLAVGIFYVGPVIYDGLFNTTPSPQEFVAGIATQLPADFHHFKILNADLKFDKSGESASGKAKLTFALTEPLFAADDFARRTLEKGDDPQVYATALDRRNALSSDLAPIVPRNQMWLLYSVAKPEGAQIFVEVDLSANKAPRGWSFADAVHRWSQRRGWIESPIVWPILAPEFVDLASRAELPPGALVLSDDSTQRVLQSYVENRQVFVKAVADAETKSFQKMIERTVTAAALTDLSQRLKYADAFVVSAVNVNFSDAKLSGGTALVMDASIEVEQAVDLYRLAKEQPSQWPEFQSGSDYEKAKAMANRYFPAMAVPGSQSVRVYELASPAHSRLTGKLQIDYQGSKTTPTLSKIQWSGQIDGSEQSLVTVQSAGQNSLYITTDPNLPSVEAYRAKMEAFAKEINTPQSGKPWKVLALQMGLAWISPGTFTMGSPADERSTAINILGATNQDSFSPETPQTQVTLTRGFWMEQFLVTQAQWQVVMGTTLEQERDKNNNLLGKIIAAATNVLPLVGVGSEYPIHYIHWDEAMEFCRRLTEQERGAGRLPEGYKYTLPTEAQWEYACRAGTTTWYYTGNAGSNFDNTGWYAGNSQNITQPVGQKLPNAWGLYDMLGNVWEWCQDWYAPYPGGSVTDPIGPTTGTGRVIRGGSFTLPAILCHSSERNHFDPSMEGGDLGFRIVLITNP